MTPNRKLTFYKPNAKCTGAAIRFEVVPANELDEGYLLVTFANQVSLGEEGKFCPRFDWRVGFKLDITEATKILGVLKGNAESIDDGKGIFCQTLDGCNAVFRMRHVIEPTPSYSFEVFKKLPGEREAIHGVILRSADEGLALEVALEMALGLMAWGSNI